MAHNDPKPANIMLDLHDRPVLADFGSCKDYWELLVEGGTDGWAEVEKSPVSDGAA
jgi:serine/threonine protein kinase